MTTVAPAQGDVIGDYEIVERIGGNMGLVFEARHRRLDKVVALKLVPADSIADPARLARFQREMRVMGQLKHPNLVPADDARAEGDWHLVAMELIDGVDLYQLVRSQGALPLTAACEAARQAAQGLQYAHEHGMIHRDIKPSNLMLTRTGTIKVIDMGLALAREDSTAQLTQTGLVLGTMSYCAPEQFRDASHVDIRADIYSLGCTLYHLLTGKSPYSQRKTVTEIMQAHLHEPFPNLTEALPDAPAGLEAVLARMTAKDRDGRFSTPREVVDALEPFARSADLASLVPAKTQQRPPHRGTTGKPTPTPERQAAAIQPLQPRARWPRIAAILALLLAVSVAIFLAVNPPQWRTGALQRNAVIGNSNSIPVVVPVDTTAERGIYDEEDRRKGISNTEVLKNRVLRDLPLHVYPLNVSVDAYSLEWRGENYVIELKPDLVVIHRSVFFHPINVELEFGYPPFTNYFSDSIKWLAASNKWESLYRMADDKLINFIAMIGNASPRTRFLVYSTGTDVNWTREEYRKRWKEQIEARFPALKGDRINTMRIPQRADGRKGTFRDANTAELMRDQVKTILRLPDP